MDFKRASDELTVCITLEDIANEAKVSHGLVRQARLAATASSYRSPPEGWERAIAKLARRRARALDRLADGLSRPDDG